MKSVSASLLAWIFLFFIHSSAYGEPILEKSFSPNGKKFEISIEIADSRPQSDGQGFCGSGQEVTLNIKSEPSRKIVFSKLIESCLESIELEDGNLDNESADSLTRVIKIDKDSIEISWLTFKDKTDVVGRIDLSSGSPVYSETTSQR